MDTRIAMGFRTPDMVGAYQNAMANQQGIESGRIKNAFASQELADMQAARDYANSPEGMQEKTLGRERQKQTAALEDIKANLPFVTPDNWNQFGQYMQRQYGNPGVFAQPYDPAIHEQMLVNTGIKKPAGQGAADYSGAPIIGEDGSVMVMNKRTGRLENTGQRMGLRPTQELEYLRQSSAEKASGAATGKRAGEEVGDLGELDARLPSLYEVADKLSALGQKATYTIAGKGRDAIRRQLGMDPTEEAVARQEYISTVDNEILPLLRATFGAAFTAAEGDRLRATLGNADMSPQEKDAALRAFIDAKEREVRQLSTRFGAPSQNLRPALNPAQSFGSQAKGVVKFSRLKQIADEHFGGDLNAATADAISQGYEVQ